MKTYVEALHAIQSGVAMMMEADSKETNPKHLRVGINSALCDTAALARLLITKGIITEEEYVMAVTEEANQEVKRYEKRLSEKYGRKVELI